jgi:hypothetical protein
MVRKHEYELNLWGNYFFLLRNFVFFFIYESSRLASEEVLFKSNTVILDLADLSTKVVS